MELTGEAWAEDRNVRSLNVLRLSESAEIRAESARKAGKGNPRGRGEPGECGICEAKEKAVMEEGVTPVPSATAVRSRKTRAETSPVALAAQKSLMTLTRAVCTGWCQQSLEGRVLEELGEEAWELLPRHLP